MEILSLLLALVIMAALFWCAMFFVRQIVRFLRWAAVKAFGTSQLERDYEEGV